MSKIDALLDSLLDQYNAGRARGEDMSFIVPLIKEAMRVWSNFHANEVLLTRREICLRWKCHPETIKRRQRAGVLKVIWLGSRSPRYALSDVLNYEREARN